MDGEPKGIHVLFGQLFQSPEKSMYEIGNSSQNVQGKEKGKIQSLCKEKDEIGAEASEA